MVISESDKKLLLERHSAAMRVVKHTYGLDARIDLLIAVVAPSREVVEAQKRGRGTPHDPRPLSG